MYRPDDDRFDPFLMAEGRHGPQVREVVGPRGMSKDAKGSLEGALRTGGAKAVAGAAVAAVAATNPVTAALYAAYTVAKYAYPVVKAGVEEKVRTGDTDRAVEAMKEETVKQVGRAVVDATVSAVSDAVVNGAVEATGVPVTDSAKKFVAAAVSEALEEMVEK